MKHIFCFAIMISLAALSHAQHRSAHYLVTDEGGSAEFYFRELEQHFAEYNQVFCFDPGQLSAPLRVRVFLDKAEYDAYLSAKLVEPKPGAVYLHYRNPMDSELVIHQGSEEEGRLVSHQAFVQFLRAFISSPPYWIQEGFAAYFTGLKFNKETEQLEYKENLDWLEYVKRLELNPDAAFLNDQNLSPTQAQALSWSVVSFLMSDKLNPYYRSLTDSFTVLTAAATADKNAQAVYERLFRFVSFEDFNRDYTAHIAGRKTFTGLVEEGHKAYTAGDFTGAAGLFRLAINQKPDHLVPYYYLGLIAFEEKKYDDAEQFYKAAAEYAGENAQIQFARGLNAAAQGKRTEAIRFLEATARDPAYKTRSEELIKRLQ